MLAMDTFEWSSLGSLTLMEEGHELGEVGLLFDKIEDDAIQYMTAKISTSSDLTGVLIQNL